MWIDAEGVKSWVSTTSSATRASSSGPRPRATGWPAPTPIIRTKDLYEAIERGEYPSWTLKVQIMPYEDARTYRFNPFDITKVWPHGDYPLVEVGRFTLDRNPVDYHTEIEQLAVAPANLVPGIGPSPDKLLLGRLFSYPDAHRARLGVDFTQIPVNSPVAPVHAYSKDGIGRIHDVSDPVYFPTPRAARRPTASTTSRRAGTRTARSCAPPTSCTPRTTTGARPARWSAR